MEGGERIESIVKQEVDVGYSNKQKADATVAEIKE